MSPEIRPPWRSSEPGHETLDDGTTQGTSGSKIHTAKQPRPIVELTVLAHPDTRRVGERTPLRSLAVGVEFLLSRTEGVFSHPGNTRPRSLGGRYLSRHPIRFRQIEQAVEDPTKLGIELSTTHIKVEANGERVESERTFSSAEIERGVVLLLARKVVLLLHRMMFPRQDESPTYGLVGESASIVRLRREIRRLAPLEVPVLLRGETGTGKELVARALHEASGRRQKPYVTVNMGVLGPSLAASELFGAARGAYTGADRQKTGYFQSAKGGTLFLDEIGEAPPEVQVMLLRALESQQIVPVGSTSEIPIDVRVIAATDARLEEAIAADRFRAPLYHRLAGYALRLPALRERMEDMGRLLVFFLAEELKNLGEGGLGAGEEDWPPADIVARLALYSWPGNVRELRNVARRLAIGGQDVTLVDLEDMLMTTPELPSGATSTVITSTAMGRAMNSLPASGVVQRPARRVHRKPAEVPQEELLATLRNHHWNVRAAAKALDVSRPNLYRMMEACPAVRAAKDLEQTEIEAAVLAAGKNLEAAAMELEVSLVGLKRRMTVLGLHLV